MSKLSKLLLACCLLLLVILSIEWIIAKARDTQLSDSLMQQGIKALPEADLAQWNSPKQSAESYAVMAERPLFIEGRRPVPEEEDETVAEDAAKIDDLELQGVYSVRDQKYALFSQQGKEQKFVKKSEGDEVSGWSLLEILTDRVILEQSGQEQSLMLRKPKPTERKPEVPRRPAPKTTNPTIQK
jgi:type II secretory pathway component PulC